MKHCPHCGCSLTKARSGPDHRRFFAVIKAAFEHWPEGHDFQPDDAEHLRAWLICKAGYRISTPIDLPSNASGHVRMLFRLGVEAALRSAGNIVAFVVPHRNGVAVVRPRSIAFDKLGQHEFSDLRNAIEDVIRVETGLDPEALLTEKAA